MSEANTVEVTVPEVTPEAPKAPSRSEVDLTGWSAKDIESAEKRGLIAKPEQKKEAPKPDATAKAEPTAEAPKEEKKPTPRGTMPDFNMTPEQEKVFLDTFGAGTPVRGVYFRMKNERHARQALEAQVREQQAQIEALRNVPKAPAKEVDADGNEVDPEDKPLTAKMLREMQQKEAEEAQKQRQEIEQRGRIITEAQVSQEEYARNIYPDFDDTVNKAKEVLQNLDAIPEKWKQEKAVKLAQDLQAAAANADKLGLDGWNAAQIAYELGQLHPDYSPTHGQRADTSNGKPKDPKQANGGLTPEQMKRIEENTQRRASSASIPGGNGKRTVTADEVSREDYARMTPNQRFDFRQKYPDHYKRLRG
jgi:hypothetical protein